MKKKFILELEVNEETMKANNFDELTAEWVEDCLLEGLEYWEDINIIGVEEIIK